MHLFRQFIKDFMRNLTADRCFITLVRIMVGFLFVFAGVMNIQQWSGLLAVFQNKHIIFPSVLLLLGIALETIAGIMLIFSIRIRIAALALIPFTLIAIFIFHNFWSMTGSARGINMEIFLIHLTSTVGALILLCVTANR
jgi:putative oxidoreductase